MSIIFGIPGLILVFVWIFNKINNKRLEKSSAYICDGCGEVYFISNINNRPNCSICQNVRHLTNNVFISFGVTKSEYEKNIAITSKDVFLTNFFGDNSYKEIRDKWETTNKYYSQQYNKVIEANRERQHELIKRTPEKNIPKCPICGSTNLEKISIGNKAGSVVAFGVFAVGHVSKTYKCKSCGSKF